MSGNVGDPALVSETQLHAVATAQRVLQHDGGRWVLTKERVANVQPSHRSREHLRRVIRAQSGERSLIADGRANQSRDLGGHQLPNPVCGTLQMGVMSGWPMPPDESDRTGAPLSAPTRELNTVLKSAVAAVESIEFHSSHFLRASRMSVYASSTNVSPSFVISFLRNVGSTSSMTCAREM